MPTTHPCVKCGSSEERYASGHCKACAKQRALKNYHGNRDFYRGLQKQWRTLNADKKKADDAAWQRENAEAVKARNKRWMQGNPDKMRVISRAWSSWRHAQKLKATPSWANEFFIDEAYRLAGLREEVCGGKWHVDHIVPLRGKTVCGLHVENNLQVIPASQNIAKGNRHWPDMP